MNHLLQPIFSKQAARAIRTARNGNRNAIAVCGIISFTIIPTSGANGSQTMKKTKILVVTLLAGFVLHQTALCQTNVTAANRANGGSAGRRRLVTRHPRPRSNQPVSCTVSNATRQHDQRSNVTVGAGGSNDTGGNAGASNAVAPACP